VPQDPSWGTGAPDSGEVEERRAQRAADAVVALSPHSHVHVDHSDEAMAVGKVALDVAMVFIPEGRVADLARVRILGEGPLTHFTDAKGLAGITGLDPAMLKAGDVVSVDTLRFGEGANPFLSGGDAGRIFVTELGPDASAGQLMQIGVFGEKQQFAIQFSRESAFANGARVSPAVGARSIFTIPGGTTLAPEPNGEGLFDFLVHVRF
jgi:hypothetical protein